MSVPDFIAYQRDDSDPDNTVIVALDLTLTSELIPSGKNLTVYAGELTLPAATIALPGRNVTLNARRINAQNAIIDVSSPTPPPPLARATDGASGTTAGQSGTGASNGVFGADGSNAGNVTILTAGLDGHLSILANGGEGQTGQDGGNGGNGYAGAPGADAQTHQSPFGAVIDSQGQPGNAGGDGGNGGIAGKSGHGGNGGHIVVSSIGSSGGVVEGSANGGSGGRPAVAGARGTGGAGGRGGMRLKYEHRDAGQISIWIAVGDDPPYAAPGKDGRNGDAGDVRVYAAALRGGQGTFDRRVDLTPDAFIPSHGPTVGLLTQRMLTLRRAELIYLNADYGLTLRLLTWLTAVTPAPGAASVPPDHATEWVGINAGAATLLAYLEAGLSFYGEPRNHAPLVTLNFYQQEVTNLLQLGKIIEDAYERYLKAEASQKERVAALRDTSSQAAFHLNALKGDLTSTQSQTNEAQDTIAALYKAQNTQREIMLAAQTTFQHALLESSPRGCSFFDVITGLVSIFTLQFSAFNELVTIGGIVKGLGDAQSKLQDTIKAIVTAGKDLQDLQKRWLEISAVVSSRTPDAAKIAVNKADFDRHVAEFDKNIDDVIRSSSGVLLEAAKNFKTQVHVYLDIIQARNQKVYEYTSLVVRGLRLRCMIDQKQSELNRIDNQIADDIDPTLPAYRTFMYGAYEDLRGHIIRYLYQENAAFNYWSLQNNPFDVADQSIGMLANTHVNLMAKVETYLNATTTPRQTFEGIGVKLTSASLQQQFAAFQAGHTSESGRKVHSLAFSIPPDGAAFDATWYQVIVTSVRISVPNAHTGSGDLDVDLIHSGRALFVDRNGQTVEFTHAATLQDYKYDLVSGNRIGGGELGGGAGNPYFIGVSPYTTWLIEIHENNASLDVSTVTEIDLIFSGLYYPNRSAVVH